MEKTYVLNCMLLFILSLGGVMTFAHQKDSVFIERTEKNYFRFGITDLAAKHSRSFSKDSAVRGNVFCFGAEHRGTGAVAQIKENTGHALDSIAPLCSVKEERKNHGLKIKKIDLEWLAGEVYFLLIVLPIHIVIFVIPLALPFVLLIGLAIKKKKKILFFIAAPLILLPYLPYEMRAFFGDKITKECWIKKHFFRNAYYLADEKGKMLVDGVFEWVITDEYIYGFDEYKSESSTGFIYDRKTKVGKNFNYDEFVLEYKKLGLEPPTRFDNIYTLQDAGLTRIYPLE